MSADHALLNRPLDHHRRKWHLLSGSIVVALVYSAAVLGTTLCLRW